MNSPKETFFVVDSKGLGKVKKQLYPKGTINDKVNLPFPAKLLKMETGFFPGLYIKQRWSLKMEPA